MLRARNSNPLSSISSRTTEESRRHGRLRCEAVTCSLGRVLDASASGMRVLCRGRLPVPMNEPFGMTIHAPEGPFTVIATAVWSKKVGFRRHEVGLVFGDLPPAARRSLTLLARAAAGNTTFDSQVGRG